MGNLLRLLSRDAADCCSTTPKADIFVDFEHALPTTESEARIYDEAELILIESVVILRDLEDYRGASKEIREAISRPCEATSSTAWAVLAPLVRKLNRFYLFWKKLEGIVPKILSETIVNGSGLSEEQHSLVEVALDEHQALVKQFAKILEFVLKFDELKLLNPALQNDFSYYRRTTQRSNFNGELLVVSIDNASAMSLFFGHAAPMLHALSSSLASFINSGGDPYGRVVDTLSVIANVCQKMLGTPDLRARIQRQDETEIFILRVMTAIIILYDHVHPDGAFSKSSPVDVKACLRVLRDQEKSRVESLFNALRYTTKHLNDDTTPKSTRTLLFDELS